METRKLIVLGMLIIYLMPQQVLSQDKEDEEIEPLIIAVTQNHWNMEKEDYKFEEWKEFSTEYFNKVIMNNEFILKYDV